MKRNLKNVSSGPTVKWRNIDHAGMRNGDKRLDACRTRSGERNISFGVESELLYA